MANPVGRPTELTPELKEKVNRYFDEFELWHDIPIEKQDKNGNVTTSMERAANPPPSLIDLARYLNVNRTSVWRWMEKDEEFCNIVKSGMRKLFPAVLIENTLLGWYSTGFACFCAKNREMDDEGNKWTDKSEITGADRKPLIPDLTETLTKIYGQQPAQIHTVG